MNIKRTFIFCIIILFISASLIIVVLNSKEKKNVSSKISNREFTALITNGGDSVSKLLKSGKGEIQFNNNYYCTLPEKYNSIDEIRKYLEPYFSKAYINKFIDKIGFTQKNNSLIMPEGDMGIDYIYSSFKIISYKLEKNTSKINYTAARLDGNKENGEILLVFEDGKWKIVRWDNLI